MNTNPNSGSIRAVDRVLDILETLRDAREGVTMTEIGDATGLPKSSVHRYLRVIESRGFVQRDPDSGRYSLAHLGQLAPVWQVDRLTRVAGPILTQLRDRLGETINLGALDGRRIAYLKIVDSLSPVRFSTSPSQLEYVHSTALGKAIAARMDEGRVRRILSLEGMPALTAHTVTDINTFCERLAKVRADGYAVDDAENEEAGRCVAVALRRTSIEAAISLSAPKPRLDLTEIPAVAEHLQAAAARIDEVIRDQQRADGLTEA